MTNNIKFKQSLLTICLAASCASFVQAQAPDAGALPQSGQVVAGQATISAQSNLMDIHQTSQQAILNWQQFNIGRDATVNFNQPGVDSVALNRVLGADASSIFGNLNANGQVFLVNPNGVLFAPGSSVDVGGLVASSMNLSNQNFLDGSYLFEGGNASVVNAGDISADYAALLAPEVTNLGVINTRAGTTALAGGDTVRLNITGNNLIDIEVSQAEIDTLVENRHLIQADGGQVIMSAQSINGFLGNVVNSGVIEAKGIVNDGGSVWLAASDSIDLGGSINADAASHGDGGSIIAIADLTNPDSETTVTGSLSAQGGSVSGDGGFIETSASKLNVADSAKINTTASNGQTGQWLLDPVDFTIAASGGDITGATLSTALGLTDVKIETTDTTASCTELPSTSCGTSATSGNGDIFVNDAVTWNAPTSLTLSAYTDIRINAPISVNNAAGGLALETGQSAASTDFFPGGTYFVNAPVTLVEGAGFSVKDFNDLPAVDYTVINDATELAAISANLDGFYVLGDDITDADMASIGASWTPLGSVGTPFEGVFDGLFNTIDGLTHTNAGSDTNVGLFGYVDIFNGPGLIQNVGLTNVNIAGSQNVGALVGYNNGLVFNSYATGIVTGSGAGDVGAIGGLIGNSPGGIQQSYADVAVTATDGTQSGNPFTDTQGGIGGLAGIVGTAVADSYALGDVDGGNYVGGFAGYSLASINSSYAAGEVTGTTNVGGFLGGVDYPGGFPFVFSSFYDNDKNTMGGGGNGSDEITGVSTANLQMASTFAAFDTVNIWELADGQFPRLKIGSDFFTTIIDLTISLESLQRVYGDTTAFTFSAADIAGSLAVGDTLSFSLNISLASTLDADASYAYNTTANLITTTFSSTGGGDISDYNIILPTTGLTITDRPITITADPDQSKVYNGQSGADPVLSYTVTSGLGLVNGDTFSGALDRESGNDASTYAINQGTLTAGNNYNITYESAGFTITRKDLSITGGLSLTNPSRVYDGTTDAGEIQGTAVFSGLVAGEDFTTRLPATSSFDDKNVGVGKQVILSPNDITLDAVGGSNPANYNFTSVSGITGDITPKPVNISLVANPENIVKEYDGTNATDSDGALLFIRQLSDASEWGFVGNDRAMPNIVSSPVYASVNAIGDTDPLIPVGAEWTDWIDAESTGIDLANYDLALSFEAPIGVINPKDISVALIDGASYSRVYDGTTDANAFDIVPLLVPDVSTWGFVGDDDARTSFSASFDSKDASSGKDVILTYAGWVAQNAGTNLSNYNFLTEQTLTGIGEITPLAISVSGQQGVDRSYNATTNVTASGGTLAGVLAADVADVNYVTAGIATGTISSPNVGQGSAVTISATALEGPGAGNYQITQYSTDASVNITPAILEFVPVDSVERVYDGTSFINIPGVLQGVFAADAGNIMASPGNGYFQNGPGPGRGGFYEDTNVVFEPVDPVLSGIAASNYVIGGTPWTDYSVDITILPKELEVLGLVVDSRTYDGSTGNVSLSGNLSFLDPVAAGEGDDEDGRPIQSDSITASLGNLVGQFASANVGNSVVVTLGGALALNETEFQGSYTLRVPTGLTGDITQAPLTIRADDQSKRQGMEFTFVGDEFGITAGQLFGQDNITSLALTSAGAAAGATPALYDIVARDPQGPGIGNYRFTYIDGKLTVRTTTLVDVIAAMVAATINDVKVLPALDNGSTASGTTFLNVLIGMLQAVSRESRDEGWGTSNFSGAVAQVFRGEGRFAQFRLNRTELFQVAVVIQKNCTSCDMTIVTEWWARGFLAGNNTLDD